MKGYEGVIYNKLPQVTPYVMNKSWIYLLPMIGLTLGFEKAGLMNLKSCFMFAEDFPDKKDKIMLLFRCIPSIEYLTFEDKLSKIPEFHHMYEPDKFHTMFMYDIPEAYLGDYKAFLQSKYSEMSDSYKQNIIKYHKYTEKDGKTVINILYKREEAFKNQEKLLNEGLPSSSWVSIPRDQEIGKRWDETEGSIRLETYTQDQKISSLINPNYDQS